MSTDLEVMGQIADLIRDRLSIEVPAQDTDLVESGLLDSLALVMLITALEDAFGCELPLDDFEIERFRSIERIAEFLRSAGVLVT
ncbi:MAG: acyl carrier protein [Actinomycetota bacterium]|nr:acyl carrier protein [Actinomycetota bacterium]